jgi:hypothetical protein
MRESIATDAPTGRPLIPVQAPAMLSRPEPQRVLFLVSAHNGLSRRAWIALTQLGHEVSVAIVDTSAAMQAAVAENDPELIVCPLLKTRIPEAIWRGRPCLVVHPGPVRDRWPSSVDWAIELGAAHWGVTVLLANGEFDAGAESWRNLNAIDDLVRDIVQTDSHLVISALAGDAAAGGVLVLDLLTGSPGRRCDDCAADSTAVQPRRHEPGNQDRVDRRGARIKPGQVSC